MNLEEMQLRIERIKKELQKIGDMRPGSINKQMNVCGTVGCKCKDRKKPKKHGPYYQLSYVHQGKSTSQFIQNQLVKSVKDQLDNYKLFRALTTEWIDLALAVAKEKLALEKERLNMKQKNK